MLSKGFARRVEDLQDENNQWFIPHHGGVSSHEEENTRGIRLQFQA